MEQKSKFKTFFKNIVVDAESTKMIMDKKSLIKKEQKAILDEYQLIGEKVYSFFTGGVNVGKEFEENCKSITNRLERINELQNEIEKVKEEKEIKKSIVVNDIIKENEFEDIKETNLLEENENYCLKCGAKNEVNSNFCHKCGTASAK